MTPPSESARVDILRPSDSNPLISARTFEHGFVIGMGRQLRIETLDAEAWLATLFADECDPAEAARRFVQTTAHADFMCPAPGPLAWIPELLALRNRAVASIRALIIAHAPGVFLLEWALLAPLLGPGDRIIAPSERAATLLRMLCPSLMPFVRVIPHPIEPWLEPGELAKRPRPAIPRLVSLGRLVRDKLVHRQIEAVDILRRRGLAVQFELAGPLHELGSEGPSTYVRTLQAKIDRLGLADRVRLVGPLEDPRAKLDFVADASLLLNLSVSLEESFGKAIAEALSCGVPCLSTRWGGLDETLGGGGRALVVEAHEFGVDLDAEQIADAIAASLADPPSAAQCYEQSRRSHPDRVATLYRAVLDEARDEFACATASEPSEPTASQAAAPDAGLLAATAPLTGLTWTEVMQLHREELRRAPDLRGLVQPELLEAGAHLRGLLCLAVRSAIQQAQAGLTVDDWLVVSGAPAESAQPDFLDRCAATVGMRGTRSSRVVVLDLLQRLGRHDDVARGLAGLRAEGLDSGGLRYIEIEARLQAGAADEALVEIEQAGDLDTLGEHEAHRLLQFARVCHRLGQAGRALPVVQRWTDRFPDSPDAAGLWQQRALLAILTDDREQARAALVRCVEQLGPRPQLLGLLTMLGEDG